MMPAVIQRFRAPSSTSESLETKLPVFRAHSHGHFQLIGAVDKLGTWLRVHYRGEESQPTTGPSQSSLIAPDYTLADIGGNYDLLPPALS